MTDRWQAIEPAVVGRALTLFSGSTFLVAGPTGEVVSGVQGFYDDDRRILDGLVVQFPDVTLDELDTRVVAAGCARVLSRARSSSGADESSLLVLQSFTVRPHDLAVRVVVRNLLARPLDVATLVRMSGDFAPLLAVKEGRRGQSRLTGVLARGDTVVLEGDDVRAVVRSTGMRAAVGALRGVLTLPARGQAVRDVVVEVHRDDRRTAHGRARDAKAGAAVSTPCPGLRRAVTTGSRDIDGLILTDPQTGAETVAAGAPWFMTLFGRDSLITSLMTLPWRRHLGEGTLHALAARQGKRVDASTEEQPGRILHETRMAQGTPLFHGGGNTYYGSTDATLLFVVLLAEAVRWGTDPELARGLLPAADAALEWADAYGDEDGDGFVESRRIDPDGLVNQGWKDSWNGVPDASGAPARTPVALVEVQGYWYAALRGRAYLERALVGGDGREWDEQAGRLRDRLDAAFWSDRLGMHVLGLDADKRPLLSATSNAGHLLWTGAAEPRRVPRLAASLMSPRMWTSWGVRTLASDHPAYNPLGYHVGTVWPHDTALLAWGFSRWGLHRATAAVCRGLVAAADPGGRLPELFGGLPPDDPVTGGRPVPFPTACSPQAWAAASPMLLLRAGCGLEADVPAGHVRLGGSVPREWEPLVVDGIRVGPWPTTVRARGGGVDIHGLPAAVRVEHRSLFTRGR